MQFKDKDYKKFHLFIVNHAKEAILKSGFHIPIHFLLSKDKNIIVMPHFQHADDVTHLLLKRAIKEKKCIIHTMVCEADMSQIQNSTGLIEQKIDVLMIHTTTKKDSVTTIFKVIRNDNNKTVDLVEEIQTSSKDGKVGGRYTDLFE